MPSIQLHIKDRPEYEFIANYSLTDSAGDNTEGVLLYDFQKATQPVEAFSQLALGDSIIFVSPGGEALELYLMEESDGYFIFSSGAPGDK